MAFDWKRLESDERRRYDRLAVLLGTVFTVLGVAGIVVSLLIGHPAAATGNVVWLLVGVATLVAGLRARRRAEGDGSDAGSGEEHDSAHRGHHGADGVQPPPA